MIVNEHIEGYIDSLIPDLPDDLRDLEEWALANGVPIIRKSMQQFLKVILLERNPLKILEIGTAIGFSTLFLERFSRHETEITTIEKVEMRLKEARKNLAGHDRIRLIEGDALTVLDNMVLNHTERYDFIFWTIHKRMREYLYELTHSDDFETVILPVGDGVAVSINKEK